MNCPKCEFENPAETKFCLKKIHLTGKGRHEPNRRFTGRNSNDGMNDLTTILQLNLNKIRFSIFKRR